MSNIRKKYKKLKLNGMETDLLYTYIILSIYSCICIISSKIFFFLQTVIWKLKKTSTNEHFSSKVSKESAKSSWSSSFIARFTFSIFCSMFILFKAVQFGLLNIFHELPKIKVLFPVEDSVSRSVSSGTNVLFQSSVLACCMSTCVWSRTGLSLCWLTAALSLLAIIPFTHVCVLLTVY